MTAAARDTMLAGRLDLATHEFAVREVPVPEIGPDEVLVAVRAAGVCLTDLHLIDGSLRPLFDLAGAVTLGHEVAGTIERIGPGVPAGFAVGQRVTLHAGQSCGRCTNCGRGRRCLEVRTRGMDYDGGWANYAVARFDTVVPIPDALPFDQAAIIPDAVSTPYAAIVATAAIRPAQSAGVWGVGGLGAHGVQVLRFAGAAPIIAVDPRPGARERALTLGADAALDPDADDFAAAVHALTGGRGLDVAFDFAGAESVRQQAAELLGQGGCLVLVGLTARPLAVRDGTWFSFRNQQIRGHFGSAPHYLEEIIGLTALGRLDFAASISGHIPLADAADAVHRLTDKLGDPVRLVLVP